MKKSAIIFAMGVVCSTPPMVPLVSMADNVRPEDLARTNYGAEDKFGQVWVFGHPSVETVRKFAADYEKAVIKTAKGVREDSARSPYDLVRSHADAWEAKQRAQAREGKAAGGQGSGTARQGVQDPQK